MLLPLGDIAYGQRMMARLRFLEEAQWWNRERLYEYRERSLKLLINTAYSEVPFYRDLMDKAGVRPADISQPDDLNKLPVVTKAMLRAGYPQQTTRRAGSKTYEACSSGSTGTNFCVQTDAETTGWHRASSLLAFGWSGWRIGEPHLQTGMTLNRARGRGLKDTFLRCHYVSAFDLSDARLDESLELLERHRIKYMFGYPGSLYFLARRAQEKDWNQPLHSVVTWGDNLYAHYRQTIESTFKTRVFDTYGCGEGIQIAAQCGQGDAYHLHTPDVIVNCLDDEGHPVKHGQPGNLLLTRLHAGPMPLIRYQIGDVGSLSSTGLCECGRGYELMEGIQGRDTDVVITPSGNRLIVHFFTGILEHFPQIKSFQIVQDELESMNVRIVPHDSFVPEIQTQIVARLREKGAAGMRINVELVTDIPTAASGKRRFVVSNISKPFVENKH